MDVDSRSLEKQTGGIFGRRRKYEGGKPIRTAIVTTLAALYVFSCSSPEDKSEQAFEGKVPSSILEDATIILTSGGKKEAVIYADTLVSFEEEDSTIARVVKVDFFDESGGYRSTLTSDEGLVRQKIKEFSVWGNVVVENDTARLETYSLHWDPITRLITTDDFVRFRRGKDILTGYGMEADNRLENVRILRDVKGEFIDVPRTEEELDKIEGEPEKVVEP